MKRILSFFWIGGFVHSVFGQVLCGGAETDSTSFHDARAPKYI